MIAHMFQRSNSSESLTFLLKKGVFFAFLVKKISASISTSPIADHHVLKPFSTACKLIFRRDEKKKDCLRDISM
jgi:hypothetical protein